MRKTNNPLANKVRKVTAGRGMLNCIYEAGVNKQRLKEGLPADFKAGPPSCGNRVPKSPMTKDQVMSGEIRYYIEIFPQKVNSHYFCTDDNRELNYFDDIKPFEYQKPAVDPLRAKQETKKKIIRPTCYGLTSIAELRIGGEAWAVRPLIDELHSYLIPVSREVAACSDSSAQHHSKEATS
ncbi:MAG: hypothetical protein ABJZ55_02095 [Fuerstiella sp.]